MKTVEHKIITTEDKSTAFIFFWLCCLFALGLQWIVFVGIDLISKSLEPTANPLPLFFKLILSITFTIIPFYIGWKDGLFDYHEIEEVEHVIVNKK